MLSVLRCPVACPHQNPRGDGQLIRQLPALLREHRLDLVVDEGNYCIPAGFTSWSSHWLKAVGDGSGVT